MRHKLDLADILYNIHCTISCSAFILRRSSDFMRIYSSYGLRMVGRWYVLLIKLKDYNKCKHLTK